MAGESDVPQRRAVAEGVGEPLAEVDGGGLLHQPAGVVIDPVARERAGSLEASSRVVQAIDGQNWTNGLRGTGRGVGSPIRPPTVCTKRTDAGPTSGSAWLRGVRPATRCQLADRPSATNLSPSRQALIRLDRIGPMRRP